MAGLESKSNQLVEEDRSRGTDSDLLNNEIVDRLARVGGSSLSLLRIMDSRPVAPVNALSAAAAADIGQRSATLRQALVDHVLIPAEKEVRHLGWQRVTNLDKQVVWLPPANRSMVANISGEVFGQRGLPQGELFRNAEGAVFSVRTSASRSLKVLTDADVASAARNGALTVKEVDAFRRLSQGTLQVKQLHEMEQDVVFRRADALQRLPSSVERMNQLRPDPRREVPVINAMDSHERAVHAHARELDKAKEAYYRKSRECNRSVVALLGAQAVGAVVDKYAFGDTPFSLRTSVVDGLSPFVALSGRLHWSAKAGVIIGSHVAARLADRWEAQPGRAKYPWEK